MKKFSIPCQFGAAKAPFDIYVGQPKEDTHPVANQSSWLSKERGGQIPAKIMESFEKLHDLSKENNMPFEDLCAFAIEAAQKELEQEGQ